MHDEQNSSKINNDEKIPNSPNNNFNKKFSSFRNNEKTFDRNNLNRNKFNNASFNQAKQTAVKEGAKMAATSILGPAGGAAVDALSKTKQGQEILNNTSNNLLGKSKFGMFKSFFSSLSFGRNKEEKTTGDLTNNLDEKVIKYATAGIFGSSGCLSLIFIVIIITVIISPLFYINELIDTVGKNLSDFGESLGNFLTFRGWCTDEECQEKEKNDFYNHIKEEYDQYLEDKNVRLNVNLLTATLTYYDPFTTTNDNEETDFENLPSSDFIDFKKSEKKVDALASKMVSRCCYKDGQEYKDANGNHICEGNDGKEYEGITYNCPTDEGYSEGYKVDIERYRDYLEEDFIRKFYFDNSQGDNVDKEIISVVDDIFSRVAFYEEYENNYGSSSNFSSNNITVTILDCYNNTVIEQVSLYQYLQGVLYIEGDAEDKSLEFLKAMAITAKNYLYAINGVSVGSTPNELRIRSCQETQRYCSVTKGCHSWEDGTSSDCDTIASGPKNGDSYLKEPLSADSETLEKIKKAIDETMSEFVVKDGNFVLTKIQDSKEEANQMILNGSSYKDFLNYFYSGEVLEVGLSEMAYPLDLKYNRVTSAFGWRVHPINKCCRHHNGTDIGADSDANIYSIADGVVITNENHYSYGNYTVIGHGQLNPETGKYEYYSLYAHQVRLSTLIKVGDTVKKGQQIGDVGSTGASTGPHLHIEIYSYIDGVKIRKDPVDYFSGVELTGLVGGALYESEGQCNEKGGVLSCG